MSDHAAMLGARLALLVSAVLGCALADGWVAGRVRPLLIAATLGGFAPGGSLGLALSAALHGLADGVGSLGWWRRELAEVVGR